MGFRATRLVEYDFDCDNCGNSETLYTGDCPGDICVHNINTAFKAVGYHKSNGMILCNNCFNEKRNALRTVRRIDDEKK